LKQKKESKGWFQPKGYLHFTTKFKDCNFNFVKAYIEKQDKKGVYINIAKHAFYPLIHRTVLQRRFKKIQDCEGNQILTSKGKHKRSHFDFVKGKPNAKPREIFFANHLDTQIYSYFAKEILGEEYEKILKNPENFGLSECISAYRFIPIEENSKKGKSNMHFAKEIFDFIASQNECVVLAFDIKKFFDSLNHTYLKKIWCKLLNVDRLPQDHFNVYKSITDFSFVNEQDLLNELDFSKVKDKFLLRKLIEKQGINSFCANAKAFRDKIAGINNKKRKSLIIPFPSKECETQKHFWDKEGNRQGIAQGTPISAFLANLYLLDFDKAVFKAVSQIDPVSQINGLYRRYSDDIIVVCPLDKQDKLKDLVLCEILKCGLEIQPTKTEITIFKRSINNKLETDKTNDKNASLKYLGFEFDGQKITIKKPSLAKYYRRLKRVIQVKFIKARSLEKKTEKEQFLHKNKIYKRYSHFGYRNFITYAYRASKVMKSENIKRQVRRHIKIIKESINKQEPKVE
jgi:hypothetical protein